MESDIHAVEIVFLLLLLFVVAFGALARKLQTPYLSFSWSADYCSASSLESLRSP